MEKVNLVIVGAGVVGLAIAARLSRHIDNVLVIDQHSHFGEETSSRNSEVIHAGIYYPKGSLKAQLCVRGKNLLYQYCEQKQIPHRAIGKLIVATSQDEMDGLLSTQQKAHDNGVEDLTLISQTRLIQQVPALRAHGALLSPSTGIVDSHSLMQSLLTELEQNGGMFVGQTRCESIERVNGHYELSLNCQGAPYTVQASTVINSAGLGAQQLARTLTQTAPQTTAPQPLSVPALHPCKGHYFSYAGKSPFTQLIYPLPEKNTTGLGIHATLDLAGQLRFGPDTLYQQSFSDYEFDLKTLDERKHAFAAAIKKYWPTLDAEKLQPSYTGIRPKLQGPEDPAQDFVIRNESGSGYPNLIQLFGIESPGLTSSLAIAEYVEKMMA